MFIMFSDGGINLEQITHYTLHTDEEGVNNPNGGETHAHIHFSRDSYALQLTLKGEHLRIFLNAVRRTLGNS